MYIAPRKEHRRPPCPPWDDIFIWKACLVGKGQSPFDSRCFCDFFEIVYHERRCSWQLAIDLAAYVNLREALTVQWAQSRHPAKSLTLRHTVRWSRYSDEQNQVSVRQYDDMIKHWSLKCDKIYISLELWNRLILIIGINNYIYKIMKQWHYWK